MQWRRSPGPLVSVVGVVPVHSWFLERRPSRDVSPRTPRATRRRARRTASPFASAMVADVSHGLAGLRASRFLPGPRYPAVAGSLPPRPRGATSGERSGIRAARARMSPEHYCSPSLPAPPSGLCDEVREPSLVTYVHVVGNRRWPGHPLGRQSAPIGAGPALLWSGVVVNFAANKPRRDRLLTGKCPLGDAR